MIAATRCSKNNYSTFPNNLVIRNPSFSFFSNDDQFYQNISASNPFSFNNCTVHFHMNNQAQNITSSVDNSRKCRKITCSSDSSYEKMINKKTESFCFWLNTDSCHWTMNMKISNGHVLLLLSFCAKIVQFTFYIVMVFQSATKLCCDFKKTYLWKLLLVKMSCFISLLGLLGR